MSRTTILILIYKSQIMKKTICFWISSFLLSGLAAQLPDALNVYVSNSVDEIYDTYVYLHEHPELSFFEESTSQYLATTMRELGFDVNENIGGYGLVCVLENGEGPTLMIRTDMDALPIKEATGVPFASEVTMKDITGDVVPVMHACGHDIHMSTWLGTAEFMSDHTEAWHGRLIMIAQPAEERASGAKAMISDDLYGRFGAPDYAIALHVNATMPAGTVGLCDGFALANVDMLDIKVFGSGGHGAYPHTAKDPIVLASQLILDLQTIVSREVSPLEPAVITVGSIHGGTKGNVIPDEVELKLTLRSYSDIVRQHLIDAIRRKCKAVAEGAGLPPDKYPEITIRDEETPAVYNDPKLGTKLREAFVKVLEPASILEVNSVMGAEDFGRYGRTGEEVPVYLYWLGVVNPSEHEKYASGEINLPPLHNARFLPDAKPSLKTGILTMSSAAIHLLQP